MSEENEFNRELRIALAEKAQMADLLITRTAQLSADETDNKRLRKALEQIRDHWACQYDHPRKQTPFYSGQYGIGVTDGHRAASEIARIALEAPPNNHANK